MNHNSSDRISRGSLRTILDRILGQLILLLAPRSPTVAMNVHSALWSKNARETSFSRIGVALDLIAQYDPPRHRRLLQDIRAIVVWPAGSFHGSLNESTTICLINRQVVERDRAGMATAMVLVHEGMHARLIRLGIVKSSTNERRIERLCRLAELHFLLRLPPFSGSGKVFARLHEEIAKSSS